MIDKNDPKQLAQIALVALLIIGCIAVLLPMIGAILFAFVLWICTWPAYSERLLPRIGGRNTLGASLMTLLLVLVMLVPMIFLVGSLASGFDSLREGIGPAVEKTLAAKPPKYLSDLPLIGGEIDSSWQRITSNRAELNAALRTLAAPAQRLALATGKVAGNGLLQLVLALFVIFFLYRDGAAIAHALYVGRPQAGRRSRRGNDRADARHGHRRHARDRRHRRRAGRGGDDRLPDRRRAASGAARFRHLLPVDDPDRPAADLGRRGRLAVRPGPDRLGDLSGPLRPARRSAASTTS
jgi:predicted PurR-regulated permease PerM